MLSHFEHTYFTKCADRDARATVGQGGGTSLEKSTCTDYDIIVMSEFLLKGYIFYKHMPLTIIVFCGKSCIPEDGRSSLRRKNVRRKCEKIYINRQHKKATFALFPPLFAGRRGAGFIHPRAPASLCVVKIYKKYLRCASLYKSYLYEDTHLHTNMI